MRRYIVSLAPSAVAPGAEARIGRELSAKHGGKLGFVYEHAIHGFSIVLPEAAADALRHDRRIDTIEESRPFWAVGSEPASSWGQDRIDQRDRPLDGQHAFGASGRGVNVYILDTGVRKTHRELVGRASYAAFDSQGDGWDGDDCHGHGTHVAATAAGSVHGLAKSALVHSVRVLNCGGFAEGDEVLWGVDWVTAHHVKPAVVNMSLAGSASSVFDQAVTNSINAGVTYVVAAANANADACSYSPARVAAAITVAASDIDDVRASFSNYGACVDLFAPGVSITSATKNGDDSYKVLSGTSMATPHVTGAVAQYLEQFPAATPAQVAAAIVANATAGRLNLNNASNTANLLLYTPFIAASTDGTAPSISIASPTSGTLAGTVTVTVNASDNDAIARVELYANDALVATSSNAPYSMSWDSTRTPNGPTALVVRAFDRSGNRAAGAASTVTVANTTQAAYDSTRKAPTCATPQAACDTFGILDGRQASEPSTPNTLNNSCTDASGVYHTDASIDRVRITSVDGTPFASGKLVEVEVHAWARPLGDGQFQSNIGVFQAASAASPQWTEVTHEWPTVGYRNRYLWAPEYQVIKRRFILPSGNLQAVRVVVSDYSGFSSPCPTPSSLMKYDVDDVVFAVGVGDGSPVCGNRVQDGTEQCDGADLDGQSCQTLGWQQGTLSCSESCTFDTKYCSTPPPTVCGDGLVSGSEDCDGSNLGIHESCVEFGFDDIPLACAADCTYDFSVCSSPVCGNGEMESGEACDGPDLGGQTCQSLGYVGGSLACTSSCALNTSGCTNNACIPSGGGAPCTSTTQCCSGTGKCTNGPAAQRKCK